MKRSPLRKLTIMILVMFASLSYASAQHCDGCSVNLNGPEYVKVGDIVTYTVTPSRPDLPPYVTWDFMNWLPDYADIIDSGVDANGDDYITLYFHSAGNTYLTYQRSYTPAQDYDELWIHIAP